MFYVGDDNMNEKTRQLVKIIKEICKQHNIEFTAFSDDWIIQLKCNGKVMYIYGYRFPNNNAVIDRICSDKSALSDVLENNLIKHIPHYYYHFQGKNELDGEIHKSIKSQLDKFGAIVCKSNTGSGGRSVYRVFSESELENALANILPVTKSIAISPYFNIEDEYRVIIINGEIEVIYKKMQPYVIGDGKHTIKELLSQTGNEKIQINDEIDLYYVPTLNEHCKINWKHNLGQGANSIIINDIELKDRIATLAQSCASCLNLEFASIDIVSINGDLRVLEINSGIMMEIFSSESKEKYNIAKSIYEKAILHYLKMDYMYAVKRPRIRHFTLPILTELAREKFIDIIPDEEGNFSIFIFKNGKRFIAKDYPFNINYSGSIGLCKNKSACASFLRNMGFKVPNEIYFVKKSDLSLTLTEVEKYLQNPTDAGLSYPMIVKPNSLTQGIGVSKINNLEEGIRAVTDILCLKENIFLLQEYCMGRDYRIVVLGDKVIQAYERIPFHVVGDGNKTIKELLNLKVHEFKNLKRDKDIDTTDLRIVAKVHSQGYTMNSVLKNGDVCYLQDIANLSLGGTTRECTSTISLFFQNLAINIASCLNLKLCGIDIIAFDIENPDETNYCILEINSAPGLDNYAYEGEEQEKYVRNLYKQV